MTDRGPADPTVTVVIAAWNAETTIMRAVDSALAQSVPVEVIVVDDCSTDATAALVGQAAARDPRLTLLRQDRNGGPAAARNRAIAESGAPWITVLDSDDWMEPERLALLVELAESRDADFVADDLWKVDEGAPVSERRAMLGGVSGTHALGAAEFVLSNLSAGHGGRREMGFLKPLMSRRFLERHGLTYDPRIRLGEDYVLYANALLDGARFLLTGPAGYVATVRRSSLSGRHPTEAHAHLAAADRAMLGRRDLSPDVRRAIEAHLLEQRRKLAWRRLIDAKGATDPIAAARCFWAPPKVCLDLLGRLTNETLARLRRRAGTGKA